MTTGRYLDLKTLLDVIAQSQIFVRTPYQTRCEDRSSLPSGFDGVDVAILDWIAGDADTKTGLVAGAL